MRIIPTNTMKEERERTQKLAYKHREEVDAAYNQLRTDVYDLAIGLLRDLNASEVPQGAVNRFLAAAYDRGLLQVRIPDIGEMPCCE